MKKVKLFEEFISEKREDVGKYNTVKKVVAELGRRPSEQKLAQFITDNYYDVTEFEKGEDDETAYNKIADLVGFYKYDTDDWEEAWFDAQNESVDEKYRETTHQSTDFSKPGNNGDIYFSKREGDAVGVKRGDKLQMIYVFQEEPKFGKIQKSDKRWENMGPASEELLIKLRGREEGKIMFDFVSNLEESVVAENTVTFTLDDGSLDDKFLSNKSLSRNLDYKEDGGDTYYVLPKRDFDRLQDWADSSGYDIDEVIEVVDESVVNEAD